MAFSTVYVPVESGQSEYKAADPADAAPVVNKK
jgi:hypothetical protein